MVLLAEECHGGSRGEKFWYSASPGLALPLGTARLLLGLSALPSVMGSSGGGLLDLERVTGSLSGSAGGLLCDLE